MKKAVLITLLFAGLASPMWAQNDYDDDIYYNPKKSQEKQQKKQQMGKIPSKKQRSSTLRIQKFLVGMQLLVWVDTV